MADASRGRTNLSVGMFEGLSTFWEQLFHPFVPKHSVLRSGMLVRSMRKLEVGRSEYLHGSILLQAKGALFLWECSRKLIHTENNYSIHLY